MVRVDIYWWYELTSLVVAYDLTSIGGRLRVDMGSLRVDMDTSCHGHELTWVRVDRYSI